MFSWINSVVFGWKKTLSVAKESYLVCFSVEGVTMSVSPSSVILGYQGTGQPVKTTFTCGGITATDVDYIASLKISRLTGREQGSTTPIVIASVRAGESGASIPDGVRDIGNRATVSGGIDTLDLKQSSIALEFQTSEFQCIDVGQYFCDLFYDDPQSNPHTSSGSTNFTASGMYIFCMTCCRILLLDYCTDTKCTGEYCVPSSDTQGHKLVSMREASSGQVLDTPILGSRGPRLEPCCMLNSAHES